MPASITSPQRLDVADQERIRALAKLVEARDGAPPLSDQAATKLGSADVDHFVSRSGDQLLGYAQLDNGSVEVLAGGAASADTLDQLLDAVEAKATGFEVWSHGGRSPLKEVAERRGYRRDRVLWQLRWPVSALPPLALADGVRLRDFRPGQDEDAWLRVNAAAFAHHPEQGNWTIADLTAREAESWFDPHGFLLAERDATVIGFHWTKVHTAALGEVYVLGVSPQAQGLHLGSGLLIAGLQRLIDRGITEVLLYVDESNTVAMQLYERYGFTRYDQDVQYHYQS